MEERLINGCPSVIDGIKCLCTDAEMIDELLNGHDIYHWEYGDSLFPVIRSGEYCKISPVESHDEVKVGDVVYCLCTLRVSGEVVPMVHMVTKISDASYNGEKWFEIGDTGGFVFGWSNNIIGKAVGTNMFHVD